MSPSNTGPTLEVRDLQTHFFTKAGVVKAVDRISFAVHPGKILCLVGESGSGKTVTGFSILGLVDEPGRIVGGRILYKGENIANVPETRLQQLRGANIAMIFQDPMSSLNPRLRVRDIVGEAPRFHGVVDAAHLDAYVQDILLKVGLDAEFVRRYPHQFSGGQRQRIGIARALAVKPDFLVCDEAVAALDVSIQAQVLNLFMSLREDLNLTYLFISHDLGVVEHLSDRVVIMNLGRVVEMAPTEQLFDAPNHPYTKALLDEVPRIETRRRQFVPVKGEIPSPLDPPSGCHFNPRCPHATVRCREERPVLRDIVPGRLSACHLNGQ